MLDRIEQMWLFISTDETGEGVVTIETLNGRLPLIAADQKRLDGIREMAIELANRDNRPIKLIRLSAREEIEELIPTTQDQPEAQVGE